MKVKVSVFSFIQKVMRNVIFLVTLQWESPFQNFMKTLTFQTHFKTFFQGKETNSLEMVGTIHIINMVNGLLQMIGRILNLLDFPWEILSN